MTEPMRPPAALNAKDTRFGAGRRRTNSLLPDGGRTGYRTAGDHGALPAALADQAIRRIFAASLMLHGTIALLPPEGSATGVWRAIDELDAAIRTIRAGRWTAAQAPEESASSARPPFG